MRFLGENELLEDIENGVLVRSAFPSAFSDGLMAVHLTQTLWAGLHASWNGLGTVNQNHPAPLLPGF